LVYVGKAPGGQCPSQHGINALLVHAARLGRTVVRLKGGDPFVFGRGVEEAVACIEAGIPVEIVPGVSSVLGASASAGIPLTARGLSSGFAVVTAHRANPADDHDWAALARIETLVVLMGVERLADVVASLIAHGRAADTPAAIVENGTLPTERVIVSTLGQLVEAGRQAAARPPALLVIGEVVRLREKLARSVGEPIASLDSIAGGASHVA
jgi:uroporphyrin-III C-methyltransferase